MPSKFITNIAYLYGIHSPQTVLRGKELSVLPCIENAYLHIEDDEIAGYGSMEDFPARKGAEITNANRGTVLPAWCDSHTHLVFAGTRENEFLDKIKGLTYAEIAAKGGGILHSAKAVQDMSEDELFRLSWERLQDIAKFGTGAVEIKSGYGLSTEAELKMLRVIKRLKEKSSLQIKSTFLGAHAFPEAFRDNHAGYIQKIKEEMLPMIAAEKLADYIDVFCEKGFFSVEETEEICKAGMALGLKPKLHVNQLNDIGAIPMAVKLNAISADHLETMEEESVTMLAKSNTIGTLLPGAAFFLNMQFPPARALINQNAAIALATDYNPGSCPCGNMLMMISLACIKMKMLPEEAVNAATINGAFAMETNSTTGSIIPGKKASIILTKKIPSLTYLPYAFGTHPIQRVMISGEWIN